MNNPSQIYQSEKQAFITLPQPTSPSDRLTLHLKALSTIKALARLPQHSENQATQLYYELVKKRDPVLLMLFYQHYQLPCGRLQYPGSAKQMILTTEKNLTQYKLRNYGPFYKAKVGLIVGGIGLIGLTGYILRWVHYMRHSYDLIRPDMEYLENRF